MMSERSGREGSARRRSFQHTIAEATLPTAYLEALERKRRQLDESCQKYIAAKDREFKQFEKDLKQQYKAAQCQEAQSTVPKRRVPSKTLHDAGEGTLLQSKGVSAVHALLAPGTKVLTTSTSGAHIVAEATLRTDTVAAVGNTDGETEDGREHNTKSRSVGKQASNDSLHNLHDRTSSAPSAVETPSNTTMNKPTNGLSRANSDTAVQAKLKRPSQLALAHRTSSSGSSIDGKLTSAMKSPTPASQPKRKRVSLAVGDTIVAPSDSVPTVSTTSSAPSHSRPRTSAPSAPSTPITEQTAQISTTLSDGGLNAAADASVSHSDTVSRSGHQMSSSGVSTPSKLPSASNGASHVVAHDPRSAGDLDDDLFGLEEDSTAPSPGIQAESSNDEAIESDEEIAGRVNGGGTFEDMDSDISEELYDPEAGIVPKGSDLGQSTLPCQQPDPPNFRRPSVTSDPIYAGPDYSGVEREAVSNGVYGSSFNRPSSKGSFTAGSLGESFMEKHAEEMMKLRSARQSLRS